MTSSHTSHTLTFSQLVGTFTVDKELIGAQDPYVLFEAGGNKCQTKAIKSVGAGTCEWKETYELKEFSAKSAVKEVASKSTHSPTVLEVTAYNHNTLRPDSQIGSGTIDLAHLGSSQLSGSGDRVTVHLTDKKGKSVGELRFLIHGGGYQGSGSTTGTHGHQGLTSGAGAGLAGAGAGTGYGTRSGEHDSNRPITGVGSGPTYDVAHQAARKAAHQGEDVDIRTQEGVAHGHPTGAGQGVHGVSSGQHDHTRVGHEHGLVASGVKGVDVAPGEVIDRKYYTGVEDRPQEQALVEQYREHNPYAKEYETTVQHTGRERQVGSSIEALGTQERVVDTHHHVHAQPHDHIARALPEGAIAQRPGGEGWVQGKAGPICDATKFEITGDRTVDKERVTNLREHREFEKEFEVKTALIGERELAHAAQTEQLNRERILLDEKNKNACEGHPSVDVATGGAPAAGITHTHGHTGQSTGSHLAQGVREATTGQHGTQGLSGQHGTQGLSGQHGTQGLTGQHGTQGLTGQHGTQGLTGQHGTQGLTGQQGTYNQTGEQKGVFQKAKEAVLGQPKADSAY